VDRKGFTTASCLRQLTAVLFISSILNAAATVHYVDLTSTSPTPPFTNWITAATNIQDAVDAAKLGDQVLVTNGVYKSGGREVFGAMTNRVAVTDQVTVRSVNGPSVTWIQGWQMPGARCGDEAVRCVYLGSSATLIGFTLTNGATRQSGDATKEQSGGGVWCASGAVVSNCVLVGNSAPSGGGAYSGTLRNCTLTGNSAFASGGGAIYGMLYNCAVVGNSASSGGGTYHSNVRNSVLTGNTAGSGGGAFFGTLNNCTVVGNSAFASGGGTWGGDQYNCIVYYNHAAYDVNSTGSLRNCCTTPLPAGANGCLENEPKLASASHISSSSPCRGAGNFLYAGGVDIDGEAWASTPAIGCDEFVGSATIGGLSLRAQIDYTNVVANLAVDVVAVIEGRVTASRWEFGDGTVVSNRPFASHSWSALGYYPVVLRAYNTSNPGGISATTMVHVVAQPLHCVALYSAGPQSPYSSWATAATNIQDAVDAATVAGALVLVSNGVYDAGGKVVFGTMSNRLAVTKPLVIQSVNGPGVTAIRGFQVPGTTNGDEAVRCAFLTDGATLSGFTLTNGATRISGDSVQEEMGGGVLCPSTLAVVSNCVLAGNTANSSGGGACFGTLNDCILAGNAVGWNGGGAYIATLNNCTLTGNLAGSGGGSSDSTLNNCTLIGNSAGAGGGAYNGTLNNCALTGGSAINGGGTFWSLLNNCTLTGNSASSSGGGACQGTLLNCVLWYNRAPADPNYSQGNLSNCCTTPLPASGAGNIELDPMLASASHLSSLSPCRRTGRLAYTTGTDIDGEPWADTPSIGCDEVYDGTVTGGLSASIDISYTTVVPGFAVDLAALISGRATASCWDFGDGMTASNRPFATHAWDIPGNYSVVLRAYNDSNPGGVSATATVHVATRPVHYVAANSVGPLAPYDSWATAARNIQDALDVATTPGSLVLVTNGVYSAGGRVVVGTVTNRVAVMLPMVVRSVNGPRVTAIEGYRAPNTTNGDGAVRCVYLADGAALAGFTLTNGATRATGDSFVEQSGGGVWCASAFASVSNCVLIGNSSCVYGGGAYAGTLDKCILKDNTGPYGGGGAYGSTLNNCTLTGNSASDGGGAYDCTLDNCTLTSNSASSQSGGTESCTLSNCIVYYNAAPTYPNYGSGMFNSCCTDPIPQVGTGNITTAPLFVDSAGGNLRLQSGSPCINAGDNSNIVNSTDLDGRTRIVSGRVDMGAYEFQGVGMGEFIAWLQQYGLPTDGSADLADTDGDAMTNWQEWICGTDPTNSFSVLKMLAASHKLSGITVSWQSVSGKTYCLERGADLLQHPALFPLQSNILGQAGMTSYTDTTATNAGPYFYRVGMQ
jgi:hypothetical protein